jgi:uncharacterized protein YkwD
LLNQESAIYIRKSEQIYHLPLITNFDCFPFPHIQPDNPDKDKAVEDEINIIRESNGLQILENDQRITQAALRHSNDMADNNFTSHIGSDGSGPGDRLNEACFKSSGWGEIIAWGYGGKPSSVVNAWMNSPPHRSIILKDLYDVFGAGYAYKSNNKWKHYWTVDFALRRAENRSNSHILFSCKYKFQGTDGGILLKLYSNNPCDSHLSEKH